jgi:alkaline phosphatase D
MHGFDAAAMPEMRAIFYAAGPNIRTGARVAPFENVHVYPLIARILGLDAPAVDGDLRVLEGILQMSTPVPALRRPGAMVPSQPQR